MSRYVCVRVQWDAEARVFAAISNEVPGLVTEAESLTQLEAKLQIMVPELLEANGFPATGERVAIKLLTE
ncbi:DUF1902 domain-containing protein [Inhella gelatinilytica]|uniref:DUF1902 domain-containing protein n=1 Tax=Inhella gelatinilytica TaxID=2795030 RepID=A0A931J1W3_9BURK|nr:DUF1902 domain-containing protein [Inhella gelatinilytica]MBH9553973.1 DUF1902 domain-containing protein [Inhella gelatinilytica]